MLTDGRILKNSLISMVLQLVCHIYIHIIFIIEIWNHRISFSMIIYIQKSLILNFRLRLKNQEINIIPLELVHHFIWHQNLFLIIQVNMMVQLMFIHIRLLYLQLWMKIFHMVKISHLSNYLIVFQKTSSQNLPKKSQKYTKHLFDDVKIKHHRNDQHFQKLLNSLKNILTNFSYLLKTKMNS